MFHMFKWYFPRSGYSGQGEVFDNIRDFFWKDKIKSIEKSKSQIKEAKPIIKILPKRKTTKLIINPLKNKGWKGER